MNIALIAHDMKKELMASFCLAYKAILEKHELFATGATGSIVNDVSGLNVNLFANGPLGEQQIIARLTYNEIDMVLFLRDPQVVHRDREDAKTLMQLCDANNIPIGTNIGTCEILVKALERGDVAWRNNVLQQD